MFCLNVWRMGYWFGHAHGELGYHYHATLDYPYAVGCFRGDPFEQLDGLKGRRLDRP